MSVRHRTPRRKGRAERLALAPVQSLTAAGFDGVDVDGGSRPLTGCGASESGTLALDHSSNVSQADPPAGAGLSKNRNASWDSGCAMPGLAGRLAGAGRHGRVGRAVKDLGHAPGDLDAPRYRPALGDRAPRWIEHGEAARVVAGSMSFQERANEVDADAVPLDARNISTGVWLHLYSRSMRRLSRQPFERATHRRFA